MAQWLPGQKFEPVIPYHHDEKARHQPAVGFDTNAYRGRRVVEQCVGWPKVYRRIGTRFEMLAVNFHGTLHRAMIRQYLKTLFPDTAWSPSARSNMPPTFCLPRSSFIKSLEWTGPRIDYPEAAIKGDSFPMTWADNDEIYTSAGDPLWGETVDGLDIEKFSGGPTDYKITKVNHMNDYRGWGGDGPKPTGMICIRGVLYLAVQNILRTRVPPHGHLSQHGSDAHIIYSFNKGSFWVPTFANIGSPMFPGHKFGGPVFINFGKDNANARDSYVYAVSTDQWDNGSNLRLGRVPDDRIVSATEWEWVCAFSPSGEPAWTSDLGESIPVLSLHRYLSTPDMVYIAPLRRYLLLTWRLHADFSPTEGTDLIILESPEPWGPFSLVHFEELWDGKASNPYCPKLPLKWMSVDGTAGYLQFSGSWGSEGQTAGMYRSRVRPFKLNLA